MAKRTRRPVTDQERALIIKASATMTKKELQREFKRGQGVIWRILKDKDQRTELTLANLAIKRSNNSALTVALSNLFDTLTAECPEVKQILEADRETRKAKVLVSQVFEIEV